MRKLPAFQLDLRSLGIFRIGLGLVTLLDLLERRPWLASLYSPSGIFPTARGVVSRFPSLFALGESDAMVHAAWWLALIASILFMTGIRSRVSALIAFYFVTCLNQRNDVPLNCGHDLERVFLFWAIFLPTGARVVVGRSDSESESSKDPRIQSIATFAFVVQLALLYAFSAFEKLGCLAWREGREVLQAVALDPGHSALGSFLAASPNLCRIATFGSVGLELAIPILLIVGRARGWLVAIAITFHIGLSLALSLDLFPATCCVVWLALLPASFWDDSTLMRRANALAERSPSLPRPVTIAMNRIRGAASPLQSLPKWSEWLIMIALLSVIAVNADGMHWLPWHRATLPARVLGIEQNWSMYAYDTNGVATWTLPRATLRDGSVVDAWSLGPPDPSFNAWGDRPWQARSELDAIGADSSVDLRKSFARWACRRENVVAIEILRLNQRMLPPKEAQPRVTIVGSLPCQ